MAAVIGHDSSLPSIAWFWDRGLFSVGEKRRPSRSHQIAVTKTLDTTTENVLHDRRLLRGNEAKEEKKHSILRNHKHAVSDPFSSHRPSTSF